MTPIMMRLDYVLKFRHQLRLNTTGERGSIPSLGERERKASL